MIKIKSDTDLSKFFGPEVHDAYQDAREFIEINAGYSLIQFRIISEMLLKLVCKEKSIAIVNQDLYSLITELSQNHLTHGELNNRLHRVRLLGNRSAHPPEINSQNVSEKEIKELRGKYIAQLRRDAGESRDFTVKNMEDIHSILMGTDTSISVEIEDIPDRTWTKDIADAATTSNYKIKLKAGKIYESLANELRISDPFNETEDFDCRYAGLKKLAACHYEMAYKLSANIDGAFNKELVNLINNPLKSNNTDVAISGSQTHGDSFFIESILKEQSDPEALYLYWSIAREGYLGQELALECEWMLEVSASRGYPRAQAQFGGKLIKLSRYDDALAFLELAVKHNEDLAFRNLTELHYLKNNGMHDREKAISYLKQGAELNGPECLALLGEMYHRGMGVEQSDSKATELTLNAIQIGSVTAESYYFKEILATRKNQREKFAEGINSWFESLSAITEPNNKIGRNDPCHCGSGEKYKKCCRNKAYDIDLIAREQSYKLFPD